MWDSLAKLHANTVEAPVYWEQMEPREGQFDFGNVDAIVKGAREHNLHVVLLWFGTWKNGNMHYVPDWVKTSLAPGSKVVRDYLDNAGLMPYLEKLKFHIVGYGCTTCIGNSGPLPQPIVDAVNSLRG